MIHIVCNVCRRIVDGTDLDAVTGGQDGTGNRADVCGTCMREAAERVLSRMRRPAAQLDVAPAPATVRQRALNIGLPTYLTRRR